MAPLFRSCFTLHLATNKGKPMLACEAYAPQKNATCKNPNILFIGHRELDNMKERENKMAGNSDRVIHQVYTVVIST